MESSNQISIFGGAMLAVSMSPVTMQDLAIGETDDQVLEMADCVHTWSLPTGKLPRAELANGKCSTSRGSWSLVRIRVLPLI